MSIPHWWTWSVLCVFIHYKYIDAHALYPPTSTSIHRAMQSFLIKIFEGGRLDSLRSSTLWDDFSSHACTLHFHFKKLGVSVAHFCSALKAALILSLSILGTLVGSSEQSSSAFWIPLLFAASKMTERQLLWSDFIPVCVCVCVYNLRGSNFLIPPDLTYTEFFF